MIKKDWRAAKAVRIFSDDILSPCCSVIRQSRWRTQANAMQAMAIVRDHLLGLLVEHRPHLEVVLGSPEALLDPPEFAVAVKQLGMAYVGHTLAEASFSTSQRAASLILSSSTSIRTSPSTLTKRPKPLPAPADDDAAALVLELCRKRVLRGTDGPVGVEVGEPILHVPEIRLT